MTDVDGLLSVAVSALGGSEREGQTTMAQAIASAFDTETHLLVQAGTGTGKSLAYLVPSAEYALRTGEQVVISTATLALQAQIVRRDLPRMVRAIAPAIGRKPSFAVLKGRRNYLCRHKLDGGYPDEAGGMLFDIGADAQTDGHREGRATHLEEEISRIRTWESSTETGDRDDLIPGVSDRAWSHVSVNAFDCLGSSCPLLEECYAERAKVKASDADLIVTNHALLAIDAQGDSHVLPEHGAVVIDEAHELRDRVTNALSGSLTESAIMAAHASAKRHTGITDNALARLAAAAESLERALTEAEEGLVRVWPELLTDAVGQVRDSSREALSEIGGVSRESNDDADAGRHMARNRLEEVYGLAERVLSQETNDVAWVSRWMEREAPRASLVIAPLSVAGTLRQGLFAESTVIATSATLALGGSFEPVAASLGLAGPEAPRYDSLDVGSPFDYGRQGILYVASRLPRPGQGGISDDALEELAELIETSAGGCLGLFSSKRAAQTAAEHIRRRTDLPVLLQGEDTLSQLVSEFASDDSASLFGTMSLWQGVDVPGRTNRLVVIDRIPFPRPDDPLAQARTHAAAARGANGFMTVSATHAALRLAQGAGRLIRSTEDRGVVAVLDSRLRTARYGSFLADSLPPLWRTEDAELVRQALSRLAQNAY